MALFIKQDFTPPILSRRWIAVKCRPNMLLSSRRHVVAVLESGLLFREDSACVEQAAPAAEAVGRAAGVGYSGWLTRGERWLAAAAVAACVAAAPPTLSIGRRGACARACAYGGCVAAVRAAHRRLARGSLAALLALQREYTALARRAMACLKEYRLVHRGLESMSAVLGAALSLLWRQQSSLALLMARCSSALLGNLPWLHEDVSWDAIALVQDVTEIDESGLVKIHHAFLVIQSTLLKHVAMAHVTQSAHTARTYLNHNERLHWLHTQLLAHLNAELKENYDALDRMYRLLKNYGAADATDNTAKRSGIALSDSWLYSDVHGGIARATMELKMALGKCTSLEVFLDSCAMNEQEIDAEILNSDLDGLIDELAACLSTVQNSQLRLKKIRSKLNPGMVQYVLKCDDDEVSEENDNILKIEDRDLETKDEVFYLMKTDEDDRVAEPGADVTTAPGKKERDATKIVLGELKRKLVKREDIMRQREKVALEKTMPQLKGNIPEFPRQMRLDDADSVKKGDFEKLCSKKKGSKKNLLSKPIKFSSRNVKGRIPKTFKNCVFYRKTYKGSFVIMHPILSTRQKKLLPQFKQSNLIVNCKYVVTLSANEKRFIVVTNWVNTEYLKPEKDFDSSSLSEGLSDVENSATNKIVLEATNKNVGNKSFANHPKDGAKNEKIIVEHLKVSPSSSESDLEFHKERKVQMSLLKDIRRHRVARKKNYPCRRSVSIEKESVEANGAEDEGLRPVEYSFGTGMALASVFQAQNGLKLPTLGQEEVFIGDGEVSSDSGNDENS